jgi:hypothetical protein
MLRSRRTSTFWVDPIEYGGHRLRLTIALTH